MTQLNLYQQPEVTDDDKRVQHTQALELLAVLKGHGGWMNSHELKHINHRFSAVWHTLRNDGHIIESRRIQGGTWEWRYGGRSERKRLNDKHKNKYYKTKHWQRIRQARMQHDGFKCCNCKKADNLQVHHWRYDLFCERLGDLMTLCRDCHERVHDNPGVHIKFPSSMDEDEMWRFEEADTE